MNDVIYLIFVKTKERNSLYKTTAAIQISAYLPVFFQPARAINQSCAPTNWWSAMALGGDGLMTGGGGAPRIFHRRRRRGFMVGVGGVRPDERALKQRTRWTGVFSCFTGVSHFICDIRWAAGAEELTVNMHAVHNFTVVMS